MAIGRALLGVLLPERCVACGDGEIGEIWVAGASVARGYWGRSEESARVFDEFRGPGVEEGKRAVAIRYR